MNGYAALELYCMKKHFNFFYNFNYKNINY